MAYLSAHYSLRLNDKLSAVMNSEGPPSHDNEARKLFPPGFFLPAADEHSHLFTRKYHNSRRGCNAGHRLSRFLLEKGAEIQKLAPGSFRRILAAIGEAGGDDLISKVNEQLDLLQNIPNNPLNVTEDLRLRKNDLT